MEVQVNTSQPLLAAQLQQQLGYRLHTAAFTRQLSALLDELAGAHEYIEIPTLTISLDCVDEADFHAQLMAQLPVAIREQLTHKQEDNIILANGDAYTATVRQFFLKYGIRAFYNGRDMIDTLHQELKALPDREQPALEALLKTAAKEDPVVWIRLYYLLGSAGMKKFFLRLFSCKETALYAVIRHTLQRSGKPLPVKTFAAGSAANVNISADMSAVVPDTLLPDAVQWQAFFQHMLAGNDISSFAAPVAAKAISPAPSHRSHAAAAAVSSNTIADVVRGAESNVTLSRQLQQGLPVENAGLVLLWMECGRVFRTLGYVVDRQFVNETAQQRAILLLHYICYGKGTAGGEEDWLLNKLLCNWPLHLPVDPALAPDETAQQAAEEMLTDYLEAWRKDRKFSAAFFSTAFLQREGTLSRRNDGAWMLQVSNRTEDILISKVSMVKYAWMPQILYVQW
jgi:hypothetical protein